MQSKIKIGILGYGNFGKFIVPYLQKDFEVCIYDPLFQNSASLKEVCNSNFLIFMVNVEVLEELCIQIEDFVDVKTKIIDVTSVKILPLEILQKYFPKNEILGTHPIFGPQSGKNGIKDLPLVLCNLSFSNSNYENIKIYLSEKFELKIIEKTADEHDREMACVQGLSHFIGRALSVMDIKEFETATKSYKQLISLEHLVGSDSWELYKTIQTANPFAKELRENFLKTLNSLEKRLEN